MSLSWSEVTLSLTLKFAYCLSLALGEEDELIVDLVNVINGILEDEC